MLLLSISGCSGAEGTPGMPEFLIRLYQWKSSPQYSSASTGAVPAPYRPGACIYQRMKRRIIFKLKQITPVNMKRHTIVCQH